ncbi:hypothetical protein Tco_0220333 [Tanacetum coccineum]
MAGHNGVKKMLVGMSTLFYWKRMRKLAAAFIDTIRGMGGEVIRGTTTEKSSEELQPERRNKLRAIPTPPLTCAFILMRATVK